MFKPLENYVITQYFSDTHRGIDLATTINTPVRAMLDGVVIINEFNKYGYGNLIVIKHKDNIITYYAHLNKSLIKLNQIVKEGTIIGLLGNTGNSTGPHLHLEYRVNNKPINPLDILNTNQILKARVLVNKLNVRTIPTVDNNNPIKQLNKDDIVEILDEELWLKTKEGYICLYKDSKVYVELLPP